MAISVNWKTRVVYIPRTFLEVVQSVPTYIYNLDTNLLRIDLKNLEDSVEGMTYPDIHRHNTTVTLSGVTYARAIEIINGFTITFEDGIYAVNLIGSNNNIADVTNVNSVSIRPNNSAGLVVTSGSGTSVADIRNAVWNAVAVDYDTAGTTGEKLNAAGVAGDPWLANLSSYAPGTAGNTVKTINTNVINLPDAIRTELSPELDHVLTLQNGAGLTSTQATMLLEIYRLYGLDPTRPLLVTQTSRTAGEIEQQITSGPTQTSVTRV